MSETMLQHKRGSRLIAPLFTVALLVLLALSWRNDRASSDGVSSGDTPFLAQVKIGDAAPAFRATTLSGRAINFTDDFRGQLVLLDFWATWCGPCRAEFPHLREAYEKFHARGFEIVGVSLDEPRGIPKENVQRFLANQSATWDVVYSDAGGIAGAYRVNAIPALFLIDGDTGKVIAMDTQLRGDALSSTVANALQ